jgi:hypothetical protein
MFLDRNTLQVDLIHAKVQSPTAKRATVFLRLKVVLFAAETGFIT